jgi:RsiW-degrading membrane proteinase PrsW (M82 family)
MFFTTWILLLAVLPGIIVSYVIFRIDKYEREPFLPMLLCFVSGAIITFPVVAIESNAYEIIQYSAHGKSWWATFLLAFFPIALNEELMKFALLLVLVFPRRFFNEPIDGIVYAVIIAMGFATMENVTYAGRFGAGAILLRAFTAVPAHLTFAILQGYYAGIARFSPDKKGKILLNGLLFSILLHGIYDFLIFQEWSNWLFVLATFALYICLFFAARLVRIQLDHSPFK